MKKHIFFCKITFNKINLICYNEETQKILHAVRHEFEYAYFESRYIFSNKEFISELIIFLNNFEKTSELFISNLYLIFDDSFIKTLGVNVFFENQDSMRISGKEHDKLKKKGVDFFKKATANADDSVITSVFPFEINIDGIKIGFGRRAKGKKLYGNFYVMSILKIILSKIDINFAKMKIHIDDIFSSELLYSFYIKNYLRERRADFGKALFIKINPNESVFWLNNERVDICYKNCIKKGIFDIIKIASKELDVLEFDVIFDCFKKLNSLDQNENVEFFEIQKEQGLLSVNVSQVAHIFYANILEILMSIKADVDRKGFLVERVFLSDFEFNYSFLEKISKDVFGVEVFKQSIEDSFRKNISNNNRILEMLKKNADFDDLLCALDFYKKIVNTNLPDSNCDLDSNKITCFLKSFFY